MCLPLPNDRKLRNERKGVLPPPLADVVGLEAGVGSVGLPLTDGYREGGTSPRCGDGNDDERGLITGICEVLFVSAMLDAFGKGIQFS